MTATINISDVKSDVIYKTLQEGNIIAYPTDTIYGLGADIYNKGALEKLFETKDRDYSKPISLLYFDKTKLLEDFDHLGDFEKKFIKEFFPGPVTLILRAKSDEQFPFPFINNGFVGIRVIDHPELNALMKDYPNPITTTSINPAGEKPAESAMEIIKYFPRQLAMIIDAGSTTNKVASTVLKVDENNYRILRESAVSQIDIENRLK